jgi:hypothetical protein
MFKDVMMLGGGKKIKSVLRGEGTNSVSLMAMMVIFFILKALVVQWSYNKVAPKLISHWNTDPPQFQPLSFQDALVFTLLVSFLI